MLDLFEEKEPIPVQFQGQFTTKEEARATAVRLGSLAGGVVAIRDISDQSPSPVPPGKGLFVIVFANGQTVNAALAAFKLANNPDLKAFDVGTPGQPIGVAHECDEREYYAIRQGLAVAANEFRDLAPQRGGTVAKGLLDTDVNPLEPLGFPPFAAGGPLPKANYVIQLQSGVIVNAAFIGHMLANYGPEGAAAFAVTRRRAV